MRENLDTRVWVITQDFDDDITIARGEAYDVQNTINSWSEYRFDEVSYDTDSLYMKGFDITDGLDPVPVTYVARRTDVSALLGNQMADVIRTMSGADRLKLSNMLARQTSEAHVALYRYVAYKEAI